MDRISRIGVFVCLAFLVYLLFFGMPPASKLKPRVAPVATSTAATAAAASTPPTPAALAQALAKAPAPSVPEQLSFLENADLRVTLTSLGGAIKEIELKKASENKSDHVVFNEDARDNIMQIMGLPGADSLSFTAQPGSNALTYTASLSGLTWQRTYTMGKDFAMTVQDVLTNPGATAVTLPPYGLSVGRAQPLRVGGHYQSFSSISLGSGWLTSNHFHLTTVNDFNPGYIPIIGIKTRDGKDAFTSTSVDSSPLRWLSAQNQFFTILLTPGRTTGSITPSSSASTRATSRAALLPTSSPTSKPRPTSPRSPSPPGRASLTATASTPGRRTTRG